MVAWRYLRSRRKETVISVIASISFLGIMLGVATLIVVMAVMNGFRAELLTRILGVNGHLIVQPIDTPLDDYAQSPSRINGVPGVKYAMPLIDGQVLASGQCRRRHRRAGARHPRRRSRQDRHRRRATSSRASIAASTPAKASRSAQRMAEKLGLVLGDTITLISPDGDVTPLGTTPRVKAYPVVGDLRGRHVGV